jgi:predicted nucleotidyltransferase
MNLEKKFASLIKATIDKHLHGAEVFLFGSRAKNTNQEFSDIDIAIKSPNLDFEALAKIRFDLEESNLPYKIDLVNYYDLNQEILEKSVKLIKNL